VVSRVDPIDERRYSSENVSGKTLLVVRRNDDPDGVLAVHL
jgi:hypothetical protein